MYVEEYFGLREAPFNATPDPRFFFRTRAYDEAYATLLYGIRARQGFTVLTGEVGTGKSTLLRRVMDELGSSTRFIFLYNTTLTSEELLDAVCAELDLLGEGRGRFRRLQALNEFLLAEADREGRVALLVDEAQNLTAEVLEDLRLISNLETATAKLLQIVLVGQPELQVRLADPRLRQVRQRVAVRYHLRPLSPDEVETFIQHRLGVAGRRAPLFTPDALGRVATYTAGIPRVINILCSATLLIAYAVGASRVTRRMVDEAAADLLLAPQEARARAGGSLTASRGDADAGRTRDGALRRPRRWLWVAASTAAALVALVAMSAREPGATFASRVTAFGNVPAASAPGSPPAAALSVARGIEAVSRVWTVVQGLAPVVAGREPATRAESTVDRPTGSGIQGGRR